MNAVLSNLQYTLTFLIVLSILVVAHEWGHFIVARCFGIRVDDFSIGFGKRVWRIGKRGDTEYNLRLLPFGGFVKIAGMAADEEPLVRAKDKVIGSKEADPDARDVPLMAENIETASDRPSAPDEFGSKPLWQRSLVIFAGPFMSFVTGYVIFCLMGVLTGVPSGKTLNQVGMAYPGGAGQKAGLRIGDEIVAINGQPVTTGEQMVAAIYASPGRPLTLSVRRGGQLLTKTATPDALKDEKGTAIQVVTVTQPGALTAALGLQMGDVVLAINDKDVPPQGGRARVLTLLGENAGKQVTMDVVRGADPVHLRGIVPAAALPVFAEGPTGRLMIAPRHAIEHLGLRASIEKGNQVTLSIFQNLADMIHRHALQEGTGGVILMYQATGIAVRSGPPDVLNLMASLSISLAIFNLLPIPILDGGHLLSFFIEWVRRGKKMTEQQQQAFLMTGLAIIGTLFLFVMTKDILRTIHHQLPQ